MAEATTSATANLEADNESCIFCIDREQKLCVAHQKEHAGLFEKFRAKVHQTVQIDLYQKTTLERVNENCLIHKEEKVFHACNACWELFCPLCPLSANCPTTNGHHWLMQLKDVAAAQRKEKLKELDALTEKMLEAVQKEGEAAEDRKQLIAETDELLKRVKETASSQIAAVRNQADASIKETIMQQETIFEYLEDFREFETRQISLAKAENAVGPKEIEESTDAEFLRKRKASQSAPFAIKPYTKMFRTSASDLHGSHIRFCLDLSASPPSNLTACHWIHCVCQSACWNQNGKLVVCDKEGLIEATRHDKRLIPGADISRGVSISRHKDGYVMTNTKKVEGKMLRKTCVRLLNTDFTIKKEMGQEFSIYNPLSVSTDQAMNKIMILEGGTLKVYDREGCQLSTAVLSAKIFSQLTSENFAKCDKWDCYPSTSCGLILHVLSEDAIIMCDPKVNLVTRFDNLETPKQIWDKWLPDFVAVSSDTMGYLYIARKTIGQITVLSSADGQILGELQHKCLPAPIFDIAVQGNELAVCCGEKGVRLFRIRRMNIDA